MKLTSTFRQTDSLQRTTKVVDEKCTIAQAFTMIESWCNDNNANVPRPVDVWKADSQIVIKIVTRDNKYINIFEISD